MIDRIVNIGCASGFWGDTETSAAQLVNNAKIDYLVFDFLAEVTMSILAGARIKNANAGYATDFVSILAPLVSEIHGKGIKVITNAGGVNPEACRSALLEAIKYSGVELNIAVVSGDGIMHMQDEITKLNIKEIDTGFDLPKHLISMNVYLGAKAISDALNDGADIVITGRCVDSAIVLGPLVHEFNWSYDDYDLLASGSLAGHIIECGAQCTGGNYSDWEDIQSFVNIGFPIVECKSDGSFVVTKPQGTDGVVNVKTVAEQILYEIGNPGAYIMPDVICDFTNVTLDQIDSNRVLVKGAKGFQPTDTYKVSATYFDGYRMDVSFVIGGSKAAKKGSLIAETILAKTRKMFKSRNMDDYTDVNVTVLGTEAIYGKKAVDSCAREVVVRIAAKHKDKNALVILSREIAPASTGMAPGIMGMVGGRPKPSPSIRLFTFLINKSLIDISVEFKSHNKPVEVSCTNGKVPNYDEVQAEDVSQSCTVEVPLSMVAIARSGDKGDHANIGVIARKPEYLPYIIYALSRHAIQKYFEHLVSGDIKIWSVPGICGINILMKHSLGGGGIASLRVDSQGKAYAQMLLDIPVMISAEIMEGIGVTRLKEKHYV